MKPREWPSFLKEGEAEVLLLQPFCRYPSFKWMFGADHLWATTSALNKRRKASAITGCTHGKTVPTGTLHIFHLCLLCWRDYLQELAVLWQTGSVSQAHVNWIRLPWSTRNSKHVFAAQLQLISPLSSEIGEIIGLGQNGHISISLSLTWKIKCAKGWICVPAFVSFHH